MNQPKNLLSIGTFSEMTRLSIKALRRRDFETAQKLSRVYTLSPLAV